MRTIGVLAGATGLILAALPALAGEWRLMSAEPAALEEILAHPQAGPMPGGRIEEGRFSLAAGQRVALFTDGPDAQGLLLVGGPAEIEFAEFGEEVVIRSGAVTLASGVPTDRQRVRFRVIAPGDVPAVGGPLVRGTMQIAAGPTSLEFGYQPLDGGVPQSLQGVGSVAPARRLVWAEGRFVERGGLADSFVINDDAFNSIGIGAARSQRLIVQRDLVLNLLAVDTSAKSVVIERALAVGELRVVNVASNAQVGTGLSSTASQGGVAAGAAIGNLRLPGAESPAGIASAAEGRNQRPPSSDGRGLGTNGFALLGINFVGGAGGVVGPGSLIVPPAP
ncbi:MAG: hypothetical protein HRU75_13715 [Planctomycetia bacterium]|nr:MAG: hypothetical protein HRU75_13715 [Planctomycetia bacterium]